MKQVGVKSGKSSQAGMALVEFAVIGAVLMLVLLTVVEIARLIWVYESLTEATRRGARVAAVCPVDHPAIVNKMVFNAPNVSGASAIINGLASDQVTVEYLDENEIVLLDPAMDDWCDIRYVRTTITGYQHNLLIPDFGFGAGFSSLTPPEFETTLPRESLGKVPTVGYQCYGVASATPICS